NLGFVALALAGKNATVLTAAVRFIEQELGKAVDRMDQRTPTREQQFIRQMFQSQSKKLLESVVRPNTARHNWWFLSRYETDVAETHVLVLGLGRFTCPDNVLRPF
ncbi:MAG: hypothetical protein NDI90_00460, partial [Nitrospira sp. BO4]|nr:hypothetical protein [Nitrospira sp. BO4]